MKVLVTGGTGVIGAGVVPELLRRGHAVRLFSQNAEEDVRRWARVEPFAGELLQPSSVRGSCGGCDAVIHIGSEGARDMLAEAERDGSVRRFVYVATLGEDHAIDEAIELSPFDFTIVHHTTVYGPRDEVIAPILNIVHTLPAVPVVDHGEQRIQPIWHEDLAKAIVALLERDEKGARTYELAGSESITLNELLDRFREITARKPLRVPVPAVLDRIAVTLPPEHLTNPTYLRDLAIDETLLDRGLRILADALPDQPPDQGTGAMHHKRFWADVSGSPHSAQALMTIFRDRVNDVMPINFVAEPGAPSRVAKGATMTMSLPGRG